MSARLAEHGARIIDADEVVKALQQPGRPVFAAMVERWGDQIVAPDGTLDRAAVAKIVFSDEAEREALGKLVHPPVRAEMHAQAVAAAEAEDWESSIPGSRVVILDIPLLTEGGGPERWGASAAIVVDTPVEVAIERLVTWRGFDRSDAEARVAAQATREQRRAIADFVVDNSGTVEDLDAEIDRCLAWLGTLADTPWPPQPDH